MNYLSSAASIGRVPMMLNWLPKGRRAAVCFTIDDIHPGTSNDAYEAGGNLDKGALRHVLWLLDRHPQLHVTLFVTPDWREISGRPTRRLLASVPYLRDRVYLAKTLPPGTMSLERHPAFVNFLRDMPRTEIALHGLHHVHRGLRVPVEFQKQSAEECRAILRRAIAIFHEAGLDPAPGLTPPGWDLPENLAKAMIDLGLLFVCSARDILTPIAPDAKTAMSGLNGVSLIYPQLIQNGRLLHITSNFQATSSIDRAIDIIECGGLLCIKAHIVKSALCQTALDGIDELYRNYLDVLFTRLEDQYAESLWWTSAGQMAAQVACNG
jgi:Uncharacterized protein conserved in bacteria (DUF2334)